jgi:hypothetical protein
LTLMLLLTLPLRVEQAFKACVKVRHSLNWASAPEATPANRRATAQIEPPHPSRKAAAEYSPERKP